MGAAPRITAFTSGLQAGGLRVPDQVIVIPSVADGNAALLAPMATDLVARKVDAILAVGPEAVRAARAATTTIPIVAIDLESDPTDSGFISQLHPARRQYYRCVSRFSRIQQEMVGGVERSCSKNL